MDGFSSPRFHVAYGAAKAGVISLVKSPWGFNEESLTTFRAGWREERN